MAKKKKSKRIVKRKPVRKKKKIKKKKVPSSSSLPLSMLVLKKGTTDEKQYDLAISPEEEPLDATPSHLAGLPIDKPRRSARDIGH